MKRNNFYKYLIICLLLQCFFPSSWAQTELSVSIQHYAPLGEFHQNLNKNGLGWDLRIAKPLSKNSKNWKIGANFGNGYIPFKVDFNDVFVEEVEILGMKRDIFSTVKNITKASLFHSSVFLRYQFSEKKFKPYILSEVGARYFKTVTVLKRDEFFLDFEEGDIFNHREIARHKHLGNWSLQIGTALGFLYELNEFLNIDFGIHYQYNTALKYYGTNNFWENNLNEATFDNLNGKEIQPKFAPSHSTQKQLITRLGVMIDF
jgi:hypothetical protein